MSYEVIFTSIARNDLDDAVGYISEELCNVSAAERLAQEIYNNLKNISEFPKIGRAIDEIFSPQPLRWVLADGYLIIYSIDESSKTINIVRIVNGKRDLEAALDEVE